MSASPALMASMAVRTAVAPVAQALATLYTGMPVWPICFCRCWPSMFDASNRHPTARICMSPMVAPASARAPRAVSLARSTLSLSG